jgi:2-methylisocitrate lyase-like PEP mutase family enzyme
MAGAASQPSPAKRLRALIEAPEILVLPGVFDGFSTAAGGEARLHRGVRHR